MSGMQNLASLEALGATARKNSVTPSELASTLLAHPHNAVGADSLVGATILAAIHFSNQITSTGEPTKADTSPFQLQIRLFGFCRDELIGKVDALCRTLSAMDSIANSDEHGKVSNELSSRVFGVLARLMQPATYQAKDMPELIKRIFQSDFIAGFKHLDRQEAQESFKQAFLNWSQKVSASNSEQEIRHGTTLVSCMSGKLTSFTTEFANSLQLNLTTWKKTKRVGFKTNNEERMPVLMTRIELGRALLKALKDNKVGLLRRQPKI